MSLYQDKEDKTLLQYFKQMLDEPQPEAAAPVPVLEHEGEGAGSAYSGAAVPPLSGAAFAPALKPQPLPEVKPEHQALPTLQRESTLSLEELLSKVETAAEPVVETKTESALETQTDTQTKTETQTQTQTAVETKTETKAAEQTQTALQTAHETAKSTVKADEKLNEAQERTEFAEIFDPAAWRNLDTLKEFQTLFFVAQGVRFAVPLVDLGGIFEYDKITPLFGQPKWYLGVTDIRGQKINVVDTLKWVSPDAALREDKYPYIIALGSSPWALGCDVLEGNRTISRDAVKWRQTPGSRPWLAGIVKDERCALLHVKALIALFNKGMGQGEIAQEFGSGA